MEIVVAALIPFLVKVIKKISAKIGSDLTILLVFVLCFIVALVFNVGKSFISAEFIKSFWAVVGTQFAVWGIFIKYLFPKIQKPE